MKKITKIFLISQILGLFIYLWCATKNIAYQDQLDPVVMNTIQKFYSGNLKIANMWGMYNGGINILGGQILLVLNLFFFKFNTRMEIVFSLFCVFITLIFLIKYIYTLFDKYTNNYWVFLIILSIIFIETSLVQWENLVFGGGSMQIIGISLFLFLMYTFENILLHGLSKINFIKYILLVTLCLIFGGQYTLGLFFTFFIVYFIELFLRKNKIKDLLKIFPVLLVLVLGFYAFYYQMFKGNDNIASEIISHVSLFNQIIIWLKFVLLTYCGSVLGVDIFHNFNLSLNFGYFIGSIILCVYVYSIILYFIKKIYKNTLLPLLLIVYANITILIITVNRSSFGLNYGLTSRYTTSTIIGLVGSIIVFLYCFVNKKDKKLRNLNILVISFIMLCLGTTNLLEWKIAPFRKKYYENLEVMALNPKLYGKNELALFQAGSVDYVYDGFDVFKKYKLNIFSKRMIIFSKKIKKLSGWSSDEWVGKDVMAIVTSGKEGKLMIEFFLTKDTYKKVYDSSLKVEITIDGVVANTQYFGTEVFNDGPVDVTLSISKNTTSILEIKFNKSFVPMNFNMGNDLRELSVLIKKIEVK